MTRNFYNTSDFEWNFFVESQKFSKNYPSKIRFLRVILHNENEKVGTFVLSCESWFWQFFGKKEHIFNQTFRAASHIETSSSKHVRFWTKVFKHVISWAKNLTFDKIWIEKIRTCQIIKFSAEIFFQKINFRVVLKNQNAKNSVFALYWKA